MYVVLSGALLSPLRCVAQRVVEVTSIGIVAQSNWLCLFVCYCVDVWVWEGGSVHVCVCVFTAPLFRNATGSIAPRAEPSNTSPSHVRKNT